MEKGDKLKALWSERFTDNVTKNSVYEVIKVTNAGFWIINDKGNECFPISTKFKLIDEWV